MKKGKFNRASLLMRKSCAATLAVLLLPHPWVTSAQAESSVVGTALQGIQVISNTVMQARMQAQMMTPINLSPSTVKNVPATNLPAPLNSCFIPQAKIPMPRYCDAPANPAELTSVRDLNQSPSYRSFTQTLQFAESQIEDGSYGLEMMLDEGKNEAANGAFKGIQCLNDKRTKETTRRQGILNAIQAQIDLIKQRNEQFKEQVKLVELQMKKTNGELLGVAAGPQQLSDRINPPIKNLPASCQAMIEKSSFEGPSTAGLLELRDRALKDAARSGGDFLANQTLYKNDVQRFINESKDYIAKNGIDSFRENGLPSFKGNSELLQRISKSLAPFSKRMELEEKNITAALADVGYKAPPLDKNFSSDFAAFKADSKEFFRKKFVNDCVTGGNNGVSLDPDTILNSLTQESTNNQGTTIINYRLAMKNILVSDAFIEDKIERLKALDQKFGTGNITLTVANSDSREQSMPAYAYFQNAVAACVADYNDEKVFSTSGNHDRSEATKVKRAETYLNDLQKLHDNFVTEMSSTVTDDILDCNGRSAEAGSCGLQGSFDVANENFCFKSANTCATQINSCYNLADQLVQTKTKELNAQADKYNSVVEGLFNDQARFFAQFRSSVMQEAGLLNALVPGSDFVFPKDLFISMPELGLDPTTNTYLRGGDSAVIGQKLAAVTKKMEDLKSALSDQGRKEDEVLRKYIAEQKSNIEDNKKSFKDVIQKCQAAIAQAEDVVKQFNETRSKAESDARAAAGDFCRRFYDLSTNPNAACGDVEALYESSNKALKFIDESARRRANELRNLCTATQSEREKGTEDSDAEPATAGSEIANACRNGSDWGDAIRSQTNDYMDRIGKDNNLTTDQAKQISDYIADDSADRKSTKEFLESLSPDLANNSKLINSISAMHRFAKEETPAVVDPGSVTQSLRDELKLPADNTITAGTPDATKLPPTSPLGKALAKMQDTFKEGSSDEERVEAYAEYVDKLKSAGADAQTEAGKFVTANTPSSYDADKMADKLKKLKLVDEELKPLLDEDGNYNRCGGVIAGVWKQALHNCNDKDTDCVKDEVNKLFDSGTTVNRSIASLNLRSSSEAEIEDRFSNLGQTDGMACDALATNKRNSPNDVESLDARILGTSLDGFLNQR